MVVDLDDQLEVEAETSRIDVCGTHPSNSLATPTTEVKSDNPFDRAADPSESEHEPPFDPGDPSD